LNDFSFKVLSYFYDCGWTSEIENNDKDGQFITISNQNEKYLSYIFNNKTPSFDMLKEKLLEIESHPNTTKSTIIFNENSAHDLSFIESFSTSFVDKKDIEELEGLMIKIPNYKHIQLQAHNSIAFKKYKKDTSDKKAIVHATGTGKSYLIAKVAQHNYPKKIGIISSSTFILSQQEKIIGDLDNIKYMTYHKSSIEKNINEISENLDLLLLDEYHRVGASIWGEGIAKIQEKCDNLELVGFSATNVRYLDNKRDMSSEIFDSNVISSITLTEAISKSILPTPRYVTGIYDISETINNYKEKIDKTKMSSGNKNELIESLSGLSVNWEKMSNASSIISDNVSNYSGKYIVFCESIEHISSMKLKLQEWINDAYNSRFGNILPYKINTFEMNSSKRKSENDKALFDFENKRNNESLNILFTVDMLNEGKHINNIDGAFLFRRTESPILFYQQIGRVFSASDNSSPLIIDMVGNINAIHGNLFSDDLCNQFLVENKRRKELGLSELSIDSKIIGYNDQVLSKISEIDAFISSPERTFDESYEILEKYKNENGHLNVTPNEVYKGLKVGLASKKIKIMDSDKNLSEDQIIKLNNIGFVFYKEITLTNKHYPILLNYYQDHGHLNAKKEEEYKGYKIGAIIGTLRTYNKKNMIPAEDLALLKGIDFIFDASSKSLFDKHYPLLLKYHEEFGNINILKTDKYKGKNIGFYVIEMRQYSKKGMLSEEENKKLSDLGFSFSAQKSLFNNSIDLLKRFHKQTGGLKISSNDKLDDRSLASIVNELRMSYKKENITPEQYKILKSIDFVFDPTQDRIDKDIKIMKKAKSILLKNKRFSDFKDKDDYKRLIILFKNIKQNKPSVNKKVKSIFDEIELIKQNKNELDFSIAS